MEPTILNINKPSGITSHDVVDAVRKKTGVKRVGHAGTLDPLATGVLLVLVGREMTKRQADFMGHPKQYVAEMTFGITSETYDAEGPLTRSADDDMLSALTAETIEEALQQFIGGIQQTPPPHSAIKVGGQPLYKQARKGNVDAESIPARTVQIDAIEMTDFIPLSDESLPCATLRIDCQKGVYIRSLAHDLGAALGTGAFLSALTRTAVGDFTLEDAMTLEEFLES